MLAAAASAHAEGRGRGKGGDRVAAAHCSTNKGGGGGSLRVLTIAAAPRAELVTAALLNLLEKVPVLPLVFVLYVRVQPQVLLEPAGQVRLPASILRHHFQLALLYVCLID